MLLLCLGWVLLTQGFIFGHVGDRYGRKKALELSILLMLVASASIGLVPNYNYIGARGVKALSALSPASLSALFLFSCAGPMAVVMLIFLRLCQGIAAGGELVGAFIFAVEAVEAGESGFGGFGKCFWTASCKATGTLGMTLG